MECGDVRALRTVRLEGMIPKDVELWLGTYLIPRADMLIASCNNCGDPVDWKHDIDDSLHGTCCGVAWNAVPSNSKLSMYRVQGGKVDLTNVILLPR
jgi:hypothetical protein